jgi:hypothetical protein
VHASTHADTTPLPRAVLLPRERISISDVPGAERGSRFHPTAVPKTLAAGRRSSRRLLAALMCPGNSGRLELANRNASRVESSQRSRHVVDPTSFSHTTLASDLLHVLSTTPPPSSTIVDTTLSRHESVLNVARPCAADKFRKSTTLLRAHGLERCHFKASPTTPDVELSETLLCNLMQDLQRRLACRPSCRRVVTTSTRSGWLSFFPPGSCLPSRFVSVLFRSSVYSQDRTLQ